MLDGVVINNQRVIVKNSEDGYNWIEPIKITSETINFCEALQNRSVYYKRCKIGRKNAMEIHVICDKQIDMFNSKIIDGLTYYFVEPLRPVVGGLRCI